MASPHTLQNQGRTDEWITPPHIVKLLGPFDLDPCFCAGQFYRTARRTISLPRNGLEATWRGRVWLNPPYGRVTGAWLRKLVHHGNGIALVFARTEVQSWFFPYVWEAADAALFLRGRLSFLRPDGTLPKGRKAGSGFGSVLVAYGEDNALRLRQVAASNLLAGHYVTLKGDNHVSGNCSFLRQPGS